MPDRNPVVRGPRDFIRTPSGSPRSSSLNGSGQLQFQINASDLATPGYALVTVVNPTPGGGSSAAEFQILYQPSVVNQTANDMVLDPANQVLYISIPSSVGTNANQVCIRNPATAVISSCQPGSEPDVLAIPDDSQFLYVGMDGTNSVQRFKLPDWSPTSLIRWAVIPMVGRTTPLTFRLHQEYRTRRRSRWVKTLILPRKEESPSLMMERQGQRLPWDGFSGRERIQFDSVGLRRDRHICVK